MSGGDAVWREEPVVRRYLEGVRGGIPLAAEQFDILLRLVRSAQPGLRRFLDLGYQEVDCFFKTFELALFGGRRPSSGSRTVG